MTTVDANCASNGDCSQLYAVMLTMMMCGYVLLQAFLCAALRLSGRWS